MIFFNSLQKKEAMFYLTKLHQIYRSISNSEMPENICIWSKHAEMTCYRISALVYSFNFGLGHYTSLKYGASLVNKVTFLKPFATLPTYFKLMYTIFSGNILQKKVYLIFCDSIKFISSTIGYCVLFSELALKYSHRTVPEKLFEKLKNAKKYTLVTSLTIRVLGNSYVMYSTPRERTATNIFTTTIFASLLGINAASIINSNVVRTVSIFAINITTLTMLIYNNREAISSLSSRAIAWLNIPPKAVEMGAIFTLNVTALMIGNASYARASYHRCITLWQRTSL
jgi:hypothetical protein